MMFFSKIPGRVSGLFFEEPAKVIDVGYADGCGNLGDSDMGPVFHVLQALFNLTSVYIFLQSDASLFPKEPAQVFR